MFVYEVKNIMVGTIEQPIPANGLILKSTEGDINQLPFSGYYMSLENDPDVCPDSCVGVFVAPDLDEYYETGEFKSLIGFQPEYHFVQFSDEFMEASGFPKDALDYFKSLKVFAYEGEELVSNDDYVNWVKGIFFKAVTCPEECTKAKNGEQIVALISEFKNPETNEWEKCEPVQIDVFQVLLESDLTIELDQTEIKITDSTPVQLTASTMPEGLEVVWESSDTDIATVEDGVVTGVDTGTCTVTATIKGTKIYAECAVTVDFQE